jgi:hypothetical protein
LYRYIAGNLFDAGSAAAVQGVSSDAAAAEPEAGLYKANAVDP